MNRPKLERLLSASLDGELQPKEQAELEANMVMLPDADELKLMWLRTRAQLREKPESLDYTPEAARMDVERAIRTDKAGSRAIYWPRFRQLASVAAVLAVILGTFVVYRAYNGPEVFTMASPGAAEVEWVETGDAEDIPMVYQDIQSGWALIWVEIEENRRDGETDV